MVRRLWEIDCLRGIAVLLMIVYHSMYDLEYLFGLSVGMESGMWKIAQKIVGIMFILIVGVSLTLSYNKVKKRKGQNLFIRYLKRGSYIFLGGMVITLATYLFFGRGFVIFGILHFIGVAIVISYPLLSMKFINLILGVGVIILGNFLQGITFDMGWLLWVGLIPKGFYSVDYYPLLPWFGFILIGIFIGNSLYRNHVRVFSLKDFSENAIVSFFMFLGKKALIIYFIHQPIILGILYSLKALYLI